MIAVKQPEFMTVEEYLEWEPLQEIRFEYSGGQLYAMAGSTIPHNDLALNLYTALRPHVRQKGCRINVSDVKVEISAAGAYRYPDVVVSCSEPDQDATKLFQAPRLIVEVLSPGTERKDRGAKFKEYCQLPSLQEYVLIDAQEMRVECYRRGEGRMWLYFAYGEGDPVELASIDFTCPIELIYEEVQLGNAEESLS
ncbi:MAG: Uma2 family endonuclease [Synechococcales cyanobacterium RM1_1_8]|nr:Uma2 family endonuclease [Synechococcales cyanobacterium RM1_1_8]